MRRGMQRFGRLRDALSLPLRTRTTLGMAGAPGKRDDRRQAGLRCRTRQP
jgi:hypothetical protein